MYKRFGSNVRKKIQLRWLVINKIFFLWLIRSRKIPLRNQKHEIVDYALVDDEDFEKINQYSWHKNGNGYAQCTLPKNEGVETVITLHNMILDKPPPSMCTDHKNGNKLDNQKSNLQFASFAQKNQHQTKRKNTTSKYLGVSKNSCGWQVRSSNNYYGTYINEEHAAYAYDIATIALHGPTAKINGLSKPSDFVQWKRRKLSDRKLNGEYIPGLTKQGNRFDLYIVRKKVTHHIADLLKLLKKQKKNTIALNCSKYLKRKLYLQLEMKTVLRCLFAKTRNL